MKTPHYVPEYFYLCDGINKVDLMDVYTLADLAISLFFDKNYSEIGTCVNGFDVNSCIEKLSFYIENSTTDSKLIECYKLLMKDLLGREYLLRTIHFKFWEKFLLQKGLSSDIIKAFNKADSDLKTVEQLGTVINKEAVLRSSENYKPKSK